MRIWGLEETEAENSWLKFENFFKIDFKMENLILIHQKSGLNRNENLPKTNALGTIQKLRHTK